MSRKCGVLGLLVCLFLFAIFDIAIENRLYESFPLFTSAALLLLVIGFVGSLALVTIGPPPDMF